MISLSFPTYAGTSHDKPHRDIATIQGALEKSNILCGDFQQTKNLVGIKKPLISKGRFCVLADKGVLWKTTTPFPSTLKMTADEIVVYQDGKVVSSKQAKQEPAIKIINAILFSILSGDFSVLDTYFEIHVEWKADQAKSEQTKSEQIKPEPNQTPAKNWKAYLQAKETKNGKDMAVAKVLSSVEMKGNTQIQSLQIQEQNGDKTQIHFLNIKTGQTAIAPDELALF